jgi:hypothetical protein
MARFLIFCLLAATAAAPQKRPSAPPNQPAPQAPPQRKDETTQPVITIAGVCARKKSLPGASGASCTTVVTRQQFEKLLDAVNSSHQNITPQTRRNLAQAYVELLAYAQIAESEDMENDPQFTEVMRLVRMRTLADFYRRKQEDKLRTPSADEIQAAYDQNLAKFEEVKLSRIFIPSHNPAAQNSDEWEKKAALAANAIRDRAARGEDLDKLLAEAYATLGLTTSPPSAAVGLRRRGTLAPAEEQEIFALSPGGVTKVEQEAAGYVVYKVESKQTLPLDKVKDEISRDIFPAEDEPDAEQRHERGARRLRRYVLRPAQQPKPRYAQAVVP